MKKYLIISKQQPDGMNEVGLAERSYLLQYAPDRAEYGEFCLVSMMADDVDVLVQNNPGNKMDWSTIDMSNEELLAAHDEMASAEPTGKVLILSREQGTTLHKERYADDG